MASLYAFLSAALLIVLGLIFTPNAQILAFGVTSFSTSSPKKGEKHWRAVGEKLHVKNRKEGVSHPLCAYSHP